MVPESGSSFTYCSFVYLFSEENNYFSKENMRKLLTLDSFYLTFHCSTTFSQNILTPLVEKSITSF